MPEIYDRADDTYKSKTSFNTRLQVSIHELNATGPLAIPHHVKTSTERVEFNFMVLGDDVGGVDVLDGEH
jgi:hypothetical protein